MVNGLLTRRRAGEKFNQLRRRFMGLLMIVVPKGFEPVVYVVGPMGKGKGKIGGVDIDKHIANIRDALFIASDRLAADGLPRLRVNTPIDGAAQDIYEKVLRGIDTCDLAIADISDRSPNVFYELAFLHSLGIPVITLDAKESQERGEVPFYAKTRDVNPLNKFYVDEIADYIYADLKYILGEKVDAAVFSNPISKNYNGIALVDISAASGLAAGHFSNFLGRMLSTEHGPFIYKNGQPSHLKHLIVVKPDNVRRLAEYHLQFKNRIKLIEKKKKYLGLRRPLIYFEFRDCIIDFPSPIICLMESPRYKMIAQILKNQEGQADEMLLKIERRWIEAYFDALRQYERGSDQIFQEKMKFMTLDEIEKL